MEDRQRIEEKLRKKEMEIAVLEERLKAARVYVQALHDVLKLIGEDEAPAGGVVLKPGSTVAQARDIILKRGTPAHIAILLSEMGKEANRENRASLVSSLAAYVRRREIFTRTAPNTFGLVELGHSDSDPEADEPPEGFGDVKTVVPTASSAPSSGGRISR